MKSMIIEAIKLSEQLTAGRYYSESGRNMLVTVVAKAMYLSDEDKNMLLAAQMPKYVKLQEVRNAIVLLGGKEFGELGETILVARRDAIEAQGRLPYNDSTSWVTYIMRAQDDTSENARFESACFLCATGRQEGASERLRQLASAGHVASMWLTLGLARVMGKEDVEGAMLGKLSAMFKQGILGFFPEEGEARINELRAKGMTIVTEFEAPNNKIGF